MKTLNFLLAIVLALGLPVARAQHATTDTPESVVAAMNTSMMAGDWNAAAAWFDPQALQDFRAMLAPLIETTPAEARAALLGTLFDVESADALSGVSDAEFFASFMTGLMRTSGGMVEAAQIIGSVAEGDDLRHVVTRSTASAQGVRVSRMDVVSLRRTPQGWRALLKGDMTGLVEALKAQAQQAAGQGPD
ncbi:hypothetical protein [Luteimonas sp. e5]